MLIPITLVNRATTLYNYVIYHVQSEIGCIESSVTNLNIDCKHGIIVLNNDNINWYQPPSWLEVWYICEQSIDVIICLQQERQK